MREATRRPSFAATTRAISWQTCLCASTKNNYTWLQTRRQKRECRSQKKTFRTIDYQKDRYLQRCCVYCWHQYNFNGNFLLIQVMLHTFCIVVHDGCRFMTNGKELRKKENGEKGRNVIIFCKASGSYWPLFALIVTKETFLYRNLQLVVSMIAITLSE